MTSGHRDRVGRIGELTGSLARWTGTHPRLVLAVAAVVAVLSLLALGRLRITSSLAAMLGTRSETAAAMERVTTEYRAGDALLLLVELPVERPVNDRSREELVAFASRLDLALRVDAEAGPLLAWVRYRQDPALLRFARGTMLPAGVFYLSDRGAQELVRRTDPRWMKEQLARNEALVAAPGPAGAALSSAVLRDPLRLAELIPDDLASGSGGGLTESGSDLAGTGRPEFSDDGRALLIHVGSRSRGSDFTAAGRLLDAVMRVAGGVNQTGLTVRSAGFAAIAANSSRTIRADAMVSCTASVGLLYILFLVFYRRWSAALVIGGVAAVGMIGGIGLLALLLTNVSPLAAMVAALLAGLGTDYGIHFLSHYDGHREEGLSSVEASVQTARHMAVPILTNCFTSIFGFISLWPSKIQMLSDFAALGAAGLVGALVAVFTIMPAALALLDRGAHPPAERAAFGRLADVVARRARACIAGALLALALVAAGATARGFDLRFESDLTVLHPRPSLALETTAEVIRRFGAQGDLVPVEVRAESPDELVIAAHRAAAALQGPACRAVGVTGVIGLHTLVPDPRTARARIDEFQGVDADRTAEAFDRAVDESSFDPAVYRGYSRFLRRLLSARTPPTVADVLKDRGVAEHVFPLADLDAGRAPTSTVLLVRLSQPLNERLQRHRAVAALTGAVADVPGATVAGIAAVSEELEAAAREGLPQSVALSLALVLIWLSVVFRRPLDVLLALLPLVFAGTVTVLFIVAIGQRFNPINSVAIPLLDGIAVDAGVFLVATFRAHGATRADLRRHLRSTTHAVLLSVSTTVTAFAALCFTHTPAVRSLGLVSAVGIVASGVGALLVLMPLLIYRAPSAPRGDGGVDAA